MISILSYIQTEVYTINDGTTHIRAQLVADYEGELPAPTGITGFTLEQGSTAIISTTGDRYMLSGGGTWFPQRSASIASLVNDISVLQSDMQIAENRISNLESAAALLIDSGAKNIADGRHADTTTGGVAFDFADDGTCIATGTASDHKATSAIMLSVCTFVPESGKQYVASGCQTGGSNNTYAMRVTTASDSTVVWETGAGVSFTPSTNDPLTIKFSIKSGTVCDGLVFKPMVCTETAWNISPKFVPYSPTNAELYQLIRSYHP